MTAPVFRPSLLHELAELHRRVKILEAVPASSSGGFTPTSEKVAVCSTVNLNGTGSGVLAPWNGVKTGAVLIDVTTPTVPTFVATGTYAVAVWVDLVSTNSGTTGDFHAEIQFSTTHGALQFHGTCAARTQLFNPSISFCEVVTVTAGDIVEVTLSSKTGSTEQGAIENAFIVRLA